MCREEVEVRNVKRFDDYRRKLIFPFIISNIYIFFYHGTHVEISPFIIETFFKQT